MSNYRVTVQTGDVRWASTDANVQIQLIGAIADSPLMKLDNSADNFERGNIDRFDLATIDDVGYVNSIRLKHDRDGIGDGWFVDCVEVIEKDNGITYKAPFDRWLDADEADHKTDVTKDVVVGQITLDQGVIKTYYVGYRAVRRDNTTNTPLQVNEQMNWSETRGVSVKHSQSISIQVGVELGAEFLGEGGKFTTQLTQQVGSETGSETSSVVANQSTVAGTIEPGLPQTWIFLLYQEVLEGVGQGDGISVPWEVRYPGHADTLAMSGWLSDQEVADVVRRTLEAQTATSGSGEPVPAVVMPDGMQLRVATRSLSGQISPASVKAALEEIERDRRVVPTNPLGTPVLVNHP